MTGITVAIDIDGVIYNTIDHMIDKFLQPNIPKGYQPKSWDCYDGLGITKPQFFKYYSKCWYEASHDDLVGLTYTDMYARHMFKLLKENGFRISIITKRPRKDVVNTIKYLDNFGFHYDSFINITDKQDKTKENFDVIVDDNPENMPLDIEGKYGLLLTQEWNKDYHEPVNKNIVRIDSLKQVLPTIESLSTMSIELKQ